MHIQCETEGPHRGGREMEPPIEVDQEQDTENVRESEEDTTPSASAKPNYVQ
jgi:hypothetical protein